MAQQSPDWERLYLEVQRRLEEEQRRREAAESAQNKQYRREEVEQAQLGCVANAR